MITVIHLDKHVLIHSICLLRADQIMVHLENKCLQNRSDFKNLRSNLLPVDSAPCTSTSVFTIHTTISLFFSHMCTYICNVCVKKIQLLKNNGKTTKTTFMLPTSKCVPCLGG